MFTESKHAKMLRKVVLKSDRVIDGAWDDRTRRSLSLSLRHPSVNAIRGDIPPNGREVFSTDKTSFKQSCEEKAASPLDK